MGTDKFVCCDENYWDGYLSREALQAECPLLARSGLLNAINRCLLSGVKRTLLQLTSMSAFDPKPTSGVGPSHTNLSSYDAVS